MIQIMIWVVAGLSVLSLVLLVIVLKQLAFTKKDKSQDMVQNELRFLREEISRSEQELRNEISNSQGITANTLVTHIGEFRNTLTTQVEGMGSTVDNRLQDLQQNNDNKLGQIRQEVTKQLQGTTDTLVNLGESQGTQLRDSLDAMQKSNEEKLDQMRQTVDEKLQSTLERRLRESFSIVSNNLETVQHGLGEMQKLATGVGDLKQVLTNVKTRGTWAEVQLGSLLEEILTPDQYEKNVQVSENSGERVEYAIRLPGRDDEPDSCVWLPIDAKFPLADYERLVDAADASDTAAVEEATKAFIRTVQTEAQKIHDKYISPPKTTDFGIMFLPTEGLYAEVLRAPGLVSELLQGRRIVVAGPTTLAAILSSLRMGFQTLAIERRSSEVREILAAVKTEFGKFDEVMNKLKRQLGTVSNTIHDVGVRTRKMESKLHEVEELPQEAAAARLGLLDSE